MASKNMLHNIFLFNSRGSSGLESKEKACLDRQLWRVGEMWKFGQIYVKDLEKNCPFGIVEHKPSPQMFIQTQILTKGMTGRLGYTWPIFIGIGV